MAEPNNFNHHDYQLRMIDMLYRALVFLIVMVMLTVVGAMVYLQWGNPFGGGEEAAAAPARPARAAAPVAIADDRVENGIHVATGLRVAEGFEVVRRTCTACHSAKLVTQNRASRDGWRDMIRWMQATQGLWDLGDQEATILDYLAANYAPEEVGRRANLDVEAIEWYILEEIK